MIIGGESTDPQEDGKVEIEDSESKDNNGEEKQLEADEVRMDQSENEENEIVYEKELSRLRKDLTQAREIADNNLNKLRYMMADFDNYRKQMERQLSSKVEASEY